MFPVLFFLTAVPWPAKIALPLQDELARVVAMVVSEIMLWMGIPVVLEGAVLHLTQGHRGHCGSVQWHPVASIGTDGKLGRR